MNVGNVDLETVVIIPAELHEVVLRETTGLW